MGVDMAEAEDEALLVVLVGEEELVGEDGHQLLLLRLYLYSGNLLLFS